LAATLLSAFKESTLTPRNLPASIQYGVAVAADFIPLATMDSYNVWFHIPMRAVRVLGEERFVACKQRINSVARFYRQEDVPDPTKTNAVAPSYWSLQGRVDSFVAAVNEIAEIVRSAAEEASSL
jgi:hypothetical protein